jgi:sulfite reductase (NADPH) flavoprotein alpha-component
MFASKLQSSPGPLNEVQVNKISEAIRGLNSSQMQWVSGFLAGVASLDAGLTVEPINSVESATQSTVTVLYGSQTGNASGVAELLYGQLETSGSKVKLINLADYNPRQLKHETHVALVVSTQGEGDPPDDALAFHEFLFGKKAPKLTNLKFSVLGLGDSSYEFFCETAKQFDQRFVELGAQRLGDRIDADVDYQSEAKQWSNQWQATAANLNASESEVNRPILSVVTSESSVPTWSKFNPFSSAVIDSLRITGRDTHKVINHIELSLEDSELSYQPGDALGVWPVNSADLVGEILAATGLTGDEQVIVNELPMTLGAALADFKELTLVHPKLVEYIAEKSAEQTLQQVVAGERSELLAFIYGKQVVELLAIAPLTWQAQELVDQLRGLTPRLYSIASSQAEVENEVHLTVRLVEEERDGIDRYGAASKFLADIAEDSSVKVFVESNRNFRLPENNKTPVIMVGAGTGVAPYRAFLQQREADAAEGDNWLFFGNTNARDEFLYQIEWQKWKKSTLLTRIDLAFSRDQAEKIYVQDRIMEQGEELFRWLESGAHFYICGDKDRMAKDVDAALLTIVAEQSGLQGEAASEYAEEYVRELRRQGRYQKDVY